MEQELRLDNSRKGVLDCKILMILITLRGVGGGDTQILSCFMTGVAFCCGRDAEKHNKKKNA